MRQKVWYSCNVIVILLLNLLLSWSSRCSRRVCRELYQRRRRRQRGRQKSNRFRLAKQQLCTCIMLFCTFLYRPCTATTWKCPTASFREDVNKRRRISFSLSKLEWVPQEINSREIRLYSPFSSNWNKRDKDWKKREFILKPTFSLPLPSSMLKLPCSWMMGSRNQLLVERVLV